MDIILFCMSTLIIRAHTHSQRWSVQLCVIAPFMEHSHLRYSFLSRTLTVLANFSHDIMQNFTILSFRYFLLNFREERSPIWQPAVLPTREISVFLSYKVCINFGLHVAHAAMDFFFTVRTTIFGFSVCRLFRFTLLLSRILEWHLGFLENLCTHVFD
jgi:hypothetical protein